MITTKKGHNSCSGSFPLFNVILFNPFIFVSLIYAAEMGGYVLFMPDAHFYERAHISAKRRYKWPPSIATVGKYYIIFYLSWWLGSMWHSAWPLGPTDGSEELPHNIESWISQSCLVERPTGTKVLHRSFIKSLRKVNHRIFWNKIVCILCVRKLVCR